jgi:hypothetical protein
LVASGSNTSVGAITPNWGNPQSARLFAQRMDSRTNPARRISEKRRSFSFLALFLEAGATQRAALQLAAHRSAAAKAEPMVQARHRFLIGN